MNKMEMEKELKRYKYHSDAKIRENQKLRIEAETYKARIDAMAFYMIAIMRKAGMEEVRIEKADLVAAAKGEIEFGQEDHTYVLKVKEREEV